MLIRRITELGYRNKFLVPSAVFSHSQTCPQKKKIPASPGSGGGSLKVPDFKRALKSGPVRFGFIPEEWFLFFHSKTGVSGPYVFGLVLINYLCSKEIFVMEHEYYSGLSIALVLYLVTTKLGPGAAASLDKEVDAIIAAWEKERSDEIGSHKAAVDAAEDSMQRAKGQKLLMDAKKENIAMQLEAVYRERMMHVYRNVRGRMDYHVKRYRAEARIHQKWMIHWILENVRKSITPEFEKQALNSAIQDLAAVAGKA